MEILQKISEELQVGNYQDVPGLIQEALNAKIPPAKILSDGLVAGMDIVGDKFRRDELFMPEVLISAKAMQSGMDILRPKLIEAGAKLAGKIVVGTVKGDLHDIGKNLVGMLMEGAGFQVIDLGIDVPVGEVRGGGKIAETRHPGALRPSHDDDAEDEGSGRIPCGGRGSTIRQGDGREERR